MKNYSYFITQLFCMRIKSAAMLNIKRTISLYLFNCCFNN